MLFSSYSKKNVLLDHEILIENVFLYHVLITDGEFINVHTVDVETNYESENKQHVRVKKKKLYIFTHLVMLVMSDITSPAQDTIFALSCVCPSGSKSANQPRNHKISHSTKN